VARAEGDAQEVREIWRLDLFSYAGLAGVAGALLGSDDPALWRVVRGPGGADVLGIAQEVGTSSAVLLRDHLLPRDLTGSGA